MRLALVAFALTASVRPADASCAAVPKVDVKLVVTACKPVDTSKVDAKYRDRYAGVIVTGTDARTKSITTGWISSAQNPKCKALDGAVITATLHHSCCDGDPNPPCYVGLSEILARVQIIKRARQR